MRQNFGAHDEPSNTLRDPPKLPLVDDPSWAGTLSPALRHTAAIEGDRPGAMAETAAVY
jgi:hypothetical protein